MENVIVNSRFGCTYLMMATMMRMMLICYIVRILSYCRSGGTEDWWQWSNVTSTSKDHERIRTGLVNILLVDS